MQHCLIRVGCVNVSTRGRFVVLIVETHVVLRELVQKNNNRWLLLLSFSFDKLEILKLVIKILEYSDNA